jgi:hypothetical protein
MRLLVEPGYFARWTYGPVCLNMKNMKWNDLEADVRQLVEEILGYLNFSSGAPDPAFLKNLNDLFGRIDAQDRGGEPTWRQMGVVLREALPGISRASETFRSVEQAEAALELVFDHALPGYRLHHRDLLFHQKDELLFLPFFIGRTCEAVLRQGPPWKETERIVRGALAALNDYIGYRPVAVLRTAQKIQPYDHEWIRPIPLYIRGAGVSAGPYRELVEAALKILEQTDAAILFDAMFPLEQLDELAVDPRAYDFDHPVNKRPNYLFGQWDMNRLDNAGRCRRFVLQQAALEAMTARLEDHGKLADSEVIFEEATVLAGTMLMGSGISGSRPNAHESTVGLAALVQKIADYRDAFYQRLFARLEGNHAQRLNREAESLKQPFGAARQHFNHYLAERRAEQLQHMHLAQLFARMGYVEAARRQIGVVPAASARMLCDMQCRLTAAHGEIDRGRIEPVVKLLGEIENILHRAIECGAMVDPWNILGFDGQFGLFPWPENSIHDYRIDDLIGLLSDIFTLYIRAGKEAAALGNTAAEGELAGQLRRLTEWWDQFASTEVSEVGGISGRETYQSAQQAASALRAWHEAGAAAGDIAFWRGHVEKFRTAKSYALVLDTLLDHGDLVAAQALLVHWLSRAEAIALAEENYSFNELAVLWMEDLWRPASDSAKEPEKNRFSPAQRWTYAKKFLDYLEANAGEFWRVPRLEVFAEGGAAGENEDESEQSEDESDYLFSAAYEHLTYRDSTDDGIDSSLFEAGPDAEECELVFEAERIVGRLAFLAMIAHLWKIAATVSLSADVADHRRDEVLAGWRDQAAANYRELLELLSAVHRHRIPPPSGAHASMVEYDRRRGVKEMLLESVINTCVDSADAIRMIRAAMADPGSLAADARQWEEPMHRVLCAVLRGDAGGVKKVWKELLKTLRPQPLLYVSLARGGNPHKIVAARSLQGILCRLLAYLPRLGLLCETVQLLETVQGMEFEHPQGPGAITEFDRVFQIGCKAIVQSLVVSSADWSPPGDAAGKLFVDGELIALLEQTAEVLLRCWLAHSRGVRLSVLESVSDERQWTRLRKFIQKYGGDLFTQHFMNLGNLRAILLAGVEAYLDWIGEMPDAEARPRLVDDLGGRLDRADAAYWLGAAVEAVVENYPEYVDYNSITTQSDRGDMLYTLLDFLRLRAGYDRVAWNLRPILLTHEVLVRCGRERAAEIWRKAVADRTGAIAEDCLRRLHALNKKYGMKLPSITERLEEKFIRPLQVDRLCAMVRPAMEELCDGREQTTFPQLEKLVGQFTRKIAGAGFETPDWLAALEDEAEQVQAPLIEDDFPDPYLNLPEARLTLDEARRQIRRMMREP